MGVGAEKKIHMRFLFEAWVEKNIFEKKRQILIPRKKERVTDIFHKKRKTASVALAPLVLFLYALHLLVIEIVFDVEMLNNFT